MLTPAQQSLLACVYLSKCEWYEHGQSGQAAKALERAGLVELRGGSLYFGIYTPPSIRLTETGREAARAVQEPIINEAIRILEAQKARGKEPK